MRMKLAMLSLCAVAALGAAPAPTPAPAAPMQPYLSAGDLDTYAILPPAPVAGSTRYEADRTVFLQSRKFQDTPRWDLAKADDSSFGILRSMKCAVGVELTAQNAPLTYRLFTRVARDASAV